MVTSSALAKRCRFLGLPQLTSTSYEAADGPSSFWPDVTVDSLYLRLFSPAVNNRTSVQPEAPARGSQSDGILHKFDMLQG
jgi:hypothetical protein